MQYLMGCTYELVAAMAIVIIFSIITNPCKKLFPIIFSLFVVLWAELIRSSPLRFCLQNSLLADPPFTPCLRNRPVLFQLL
jgi:hypothetical protein